MTALTYAWRDGDDDHVVRLVRVSGTDGRPFLFGTDPRRRPLKVRSFYITTTPVTQALWIHVMGSNPSERAAPRHPVENVSWDDLTQPGGFLDRINSSKIVTALGGSERQRRFRLPSEAEWEYAARGGPHWRDGFVFSGSNDPDRVAWYGRRWTATHELMSRLFGPGLGWRIANKLPSVRRDFSATHDVATKEPNQLGVYDMSGNVWEWCQDACAEDINDLPSDGAPWLGPGPDRRLRGGCHHNWDLHCTVFWRYGIARDYHDGCIGFRMVLEP